MGQSVVPEPGTDVDDAAARFVIRLLTPDGQTAGVGVLVGPQHFLTCAHVVNVALGRVDLRDQTPPTESERVHVDFPLLTAASGGQVAPAQERSPLQARVACWVPPPTLRTPGDDVAGLILDLETDPQPDDARPAKLARTPCRVGRPVRVFGYPGTPPRPNGHWVQARVQGHVGGGFLQVDVAAGSAVVIQPGFSGSPIVDEGTGRVVGLVATAPDGQSGQRDSRGLSVARLVSAWPQVLGSAQELGRHRPARSRPERGGQVTSGQVTSGQEFGTGTETGPAAGTVTVLHVSDPQFGKNHTVFGGNGLTTADQAHDTLFARLHTDLAGLEADQGLRPDLLVVTGDLAEWGRPDEFGEAFEFLGALADSVDLPRDRVAIVPGNHDISRNLCRAYFLELEDEDREPEPPFWPKWRHFAAAFTEFYAEVPGVSFTPDEPWTWFELPDLAMVVAGLNSTMAESHQEGDHYGQVGEAQLRWFADRLTEYRRRGWLRLGAVHHNAVRGAVRDDENLRDADLLDRLLGESGLLNLLLHGHTHDGRLHRLGSGVVALSTGSAAVSAKARESEIPNQYQLVTIGRDGFTRHARHYAVAQHRWIGDTRISRDGSTWQVRQTYQLRDVDATFPPPTPPPDEPSPDEPSPDEPPSGDDGRFDPTAGRGGPHRGDRPGIDGDFFDRVVEATTVSHPEATVTPRREAGYLRVAQPLPVGGCCIWPVGVVDGEATPTALDAFTSGVHASFAAADPQVPSELVHAGGPAGDALTALARSRGIRLRSFVAYQGLLDLRPLLERQTATLAADRVYPEALYVPQRFKLLDDAADAAPQDRLLDQVLEWLGSDGARFVMLLGDFGRGKTFLLRQLARVLPDRLPALQPVLVQLRTLEKAPSLDELLAAHLVRHEVDTFDLKKLRYMIDSGRLALLFDGFDELQLRVGYDNAADYLQTLLQAVTGRAKVALTSRTQHFRSTDQIRQARTALGDRVTTLAASRVAVIEDFTPEQIRDFLTRHYNGDADKARGRFALLEDVHDLLGLSRNPRMLSFIADLDEDRLRAVEREHGQISAADLYRELVDRWLVFERDRQAPRGGRPALDEQERLRACTTLALRLWASTAPTIPASDLAEAACTLHGLAERGYSDEQAAHTIGSGTLLVRTDDGAFTFVHQSVMEWLVANEAADRLKSARTASSLTSQTMSDLMLDFLCDLAGHDVARSWATGVLAQPSDDSGGGDAEGDGAGRASDHAKGNALAVLQRLSPDPQQPSPETTRRNLAGMDLRDRDLAGQDLTGANLAVADLSGMRLSRVRLDRADLRGADFTGARITGGSLAGAEWSAAGGGGRPSSAWTDSTPCPPRTASTRLPAPAETTRTVFSRSPRPRRGVWRSPHRATCWPSAVTGMSNSWMCPRARRSVTLSGHTDGVSSVAFSPTEPPSPPPPPTRQLACGTPLPVPVAPL